MGHRGHTAERTCIGCRTARSRDKLVRLVLGPDGMVVVDLDRRLPGRGANVCPDIKCMEEAVNKDAFSRAFRRPVSRIEADELAVVLKERLEEKLSGLLGMGQRARQLISGGTALELGLKRGQVQLLLLATDIAPEQRARWLGLFESSGRPWASRFTKEELGAFMGKELRSAVGITSPKLAQAVERLISLIQGIDKDRKGVSVHDHDENI